MNTIVGTKMSLCENKLFMPLHNPNETTIQTHRSIFEHLLEAATAIDSISVIYDDQTIRGNFGFPQSFRKIVPIINLRTTQNPPIKSTVQVLYHGLSACWGFKSQIVGYNLKKHWNLSLPQEIVRNDARCAPRYLLSSSQGWFFSSTQGLGDLKVRDLSTAGMSILYDPTLFFLQKGELIRGLLELGNIQLPLVAQVRHTETDISGQNYAISGCSFEKISNWSRLEIQKKLQQIPNATIRRIQ